MIGVVYLLTSIETGKGYVGSTINLTKRLSKHRSEKSNSCRSKLLGPFEHIILEEFIDDNITDKDEFLLKLEWVERKWQDLYLGNIVNEQRSQVTSEERIEKKRECCTKWREEHSEQIKEYGAKYYAEHSEKNKKYSAKYYAEHTEKLTEKFNCECGGKYTHQHKSHHIKSTKHQDYIAANLPGPQSIPDTQ
tara:strand:+ start:1136 stop:1711 length:576 start_codon:yes stop_codon:yes gene_type:complete